jgi:hypothetical protein
MIHILHLAKNPVTDEQGDTCFRSSERTVLVVTALASFTFAIFCFAKATPHEVGIKLAAAAMLIGILFLGWGCIACEVQFLTKTKLVFIVWRFCGIKLYGYSVLYKSVELKLRHIGASGKSSIKICPWYTMQIEKTLFLFEYPGRSEISEDDLKKLRRELGFS